MELLKEVANFSGKSGLYRILKPGRNGVIVESMDDKREKSMMNATARVSVLKDISIFMADTDKATPIGDVFTTIHDKYQGEFLEPKNMSDYELVDFMTTILPGYDTEKVYLSDIRKVMSWYNILVKYLPEVFEKTEQNKADSNKEVETVENATVEAPTESKAKGKKK